MIWLGTSGYSYDDWRGIYYPPNLSAEERLAFYAGEFKAVELDFTYYRMPTVEHLHKLAGQTPEGFQFSVKAHQDLTHTRRDDPLPAAQFRAALAPLHSAGKLGAVLLQFPYSFRNTPENVDYLRRCAERLSELPLVIEFRHSDWLTRRTLSLLHELGIGFCNVDMPALPGLLPKTAWVVAPTAYVRLHGRNAEKWWQHEQAWERYNYAYSEQELREWVPHLREMDAQAENLFVFANNHWQGQSVSTIRQLRLILDQD